MILEFVVLKLVLWGSCYIGTLKKSLSYLNNKNGFPCLVNMVMFNFILNCYTISVLNTGNFFKTI
jgi:hypothetical protein